MLHREMWLELGGRLDDNCTDFAHASLISWNIKSTFKSNTIATLRFCLPVLPTHDSVLLIHNSNPSCDVNRKKKTTQRCYKITKLSMRKREWVIINKLLVYLMSDLSCDQSNANRFYQMVDSKGWYIMVGRIKRIVMILTISLHVELP